MMKKKRFIYANLVIVAFVVLAMVSCKKDDKPAPTPNFTYEINDKTVTFTNTSLDATEYSWDFGDGSAVSAETNPVHEYTDYGDYDVRLTATGDGGSVTKKETFTLNRESGITIDGDVSDWADKDVAVSYTGGEGGFLTEMKLEWDAVYLYVYLKGTSDFAAWVDIYIDADGDSLTGAATWLYPTGCGAEFLLEGDIAGGDNADLFADYPGSDDWCWDLNGVCGAPTPIVAQGAGLVFTGGLHSGEIEFAIVKAMIPNLSTEAIGIGVNDYSKVVSSGWADWGYYAQLPHTGQADSKLYQWEF